MALATSPSTNSANWTFPGFDHGVLPDGNYTATIAAGSVLDIAGNQPLTDAVITFSFLDGDANHDNTINALDFNVLASNYGLAGRSYSQGDFNCDGSVNSSDFTVLATRFNFALAAPALGTVVTSSAMPRAASGALLFADSPVKDDDLPSQLA
jgi:hypothetical protein